MMKPNKNQQLYFNDKELSKACYIQHVCSYALYVAKLCPCDDDIWIKLSQQGKVGGEGGGEREGNGIIFSPW